MEGLPAIMAADALAGIPADAVGAARGTLGGALGVAESSGGEGANVLRELARGAFTESLALVSAISAAMVVATAVFALVRLRQIPIRSDSAEQPEFPAAA